MKNVLVVAAHADDEVLGCGGTMARHVGAGDKVYAYILCPERIDQAIAAEKIIGHHVMQGIYKDQIFDTYPILSITKKIEEIVESIKPHIVYTHWIGDLNKDHEIAARATLTACRPLPGSTVEAIYGFEIPSSTEWSLQPFIPTHFESLAQDHWKKKGEALDCYKGEIKEIPHARSYNAIYSMAQKRGAEAGVRLAESFHTYRTIRR